jgi:hypothetical protein
MVVTRQELKSTIKGVLIATGTWMLVLPLRDYITNISPIKDTSIIGIALLIIVAFWD